MNIVPAMMYFAGSGRCSVSPVDSPTVAKAEMTSKRTSSMWALVRCAIEIVEIADPGLLGNPEPHVPLARPMMARGAMASPMADESESVQIVPQEIEIGAQLQLRFDTVD